jgi:hypothetical protein
MNTKASEELWSDEVDGALARWENLQAQENEAKRQVELLVAKGTMAYTDAIAVELCERISAGELLIVICRDENMPTVRRVTQWIKENLDFAALYKDSVNDRLTIFEEEVVLIADDASNDFK